MTPNLDDTHALLLAKIEDLVDQGRVHSTFITDLRIHQNAEAVAVEHLATEIKSLSVTVGELRDVMNRGRGALWGIGAAAAGAGGLVSYIGHKFFGAG